MKHMRKILALMIAVVMCMAMSVTAFADDPVPGTYDSQTAAPTPKTISVKSTDNHTYDLYQLFTGDVSGTTLTGLKYGASFGADAGKAVTATDMALLEKITEHGTSVAQDQADIEDLKALVARATTKVATISKDAPYESAVPGFYMLLDKGTTVADVTQDPDNGISLNLFKVISANLEVAPKRDVPEVEKKVDDKNDSNTTEDTVDWHDTADYDVNDMVPFKITAKTADNVDAYHKYHLTICDTQDPGLDAPEKYTITILGKTFYMKADGSFYEDADFATPDTTDPGVETTTNGTKITISKATVTDTTFAIKASFEKTPAYDVEPTNPTYDEVAALNLINSEVNSKDLVVTYESKLNSSAVIGNPGNPNTVTLKYSSNPNDFDDQDTNEKETKPDTVVVFTYKLDVDKIDQDYANLDGAGFTLLKKYAALPETDPETTAVAYPTGETADATLKAAAAGTFYKDGDVYWKVVETISTGTSFSFKRIDDGDYKLVETTVPTGYNRAADVNFTVSATHAADTDVVENLVLESLTCSEATFQANKDGGAFTFTKIDDPTKTHVNGTPSDTEAKVAAAIVNKSGATLPETGGMGTTIFYIIGAILVVGAGVVLVTRRRMSAN